MYCGDRFSFLKVFQHALTYEQAGADNRILRNYLHLPVFIQKALLRLKALRYKSHKKISLREVVFIDPARIVCDEHGQWHSVYMERAARLFERERATVLSRTHEPKMHFTASIDQLSREYPFPDRLEIEMLSEITLVAQKVLRTKTWTENERKHILSITT